MKDSDDRQFVDGSDGKSPDVSMQKFYRESLLSQHPAAGRFHGSVQKPGAFKMRYKAPRRSEATQVRHSDSEVSDYLDDNSFIVADNVLEFDSSEK